MNKIPNPAQVAANRTARLVREAKTPVYTSTSKPAVREHFMAVEVDSGMGRYWNTVPESQVDAFINSIPQSYDVSDVDHSLKCWCFQ